VAPRGGEREGLGKLISWTAKRVHRRELELQLEKQVETGRLEEVPPPPARAGKIAEHKEDSGTFEPADKVDKLNDLFGNLFEGKETKGIPKWVDREWSEEDLPGMRELDRTVVQEALVDMSGGKTCAEDAVVAEMLK
jgi:hypothetical protein